jgi:hypothetical protein
MSRRTKDPAKTPKAPPATPATPAGLLQSPWMACFLAMLVALTLRVIAAMSIPALTYDGVFYLRQAMRLLHGTYRFEGFPPGLPLLVAPFAAMGIDLEIAAVCINLLAGVASVGLLYWLAHRQLGATAALVLALLLAVHPNYIRIDVEVLSEPVYILVLLAAFLLYEQRRTTWCGALLGYAFLLRPESLVLLPGLAIAHRISERKVPWGMLLVGAIPVVAFAALSSREVGSFVISAKQGQLDLGAAVWERTRIALKTLHAVFPIVLVPVAIAECVRRRSIYLLPLLYLAVLPFYDIHIQQRMHLPAVVFLSLLSALWLARQTVAVRNVGIVVSMALLLWGTAGSTRSFFEPSIVLEHSRQIGAELQPHLGFDDKVAARFPFIPYYAGAGFVRIENLSYETILDSIQAQGATHLLLLENEAVNVRPQLRDLFESDAFARTESRLRLVHKVEAYPFERAILYALQTPPIPASVPSVAGGFHRATWFGDNWLGIDNQGQLQVHAGDAAGTILEQSWQAHSGAALQDLCVSHNATQVAVLTRAGALLVYSRSDKSWTVFQLQGHHDLRSPCWVDEQTLVFVEGAGRLRALDTSTERWLDVGVADIPDDTIALAIATRSRGGDHDTDVAITYLRHNEDNVLQRAIATARWPQHTVAPKTTRLELPLRWGTIVSLHDDRVAWVPGRDQLIISAAILTFEDQQMVGHIGRLSVIQQDGQARRLLYHDPESRAPQTVPVTGPHGDKTRFRLLYLGTAGSMQWMELHLDDLHIPDVTVLRDPRLRP